MNLLAASRGELNPKIECSLGIHSHQVLKTVNERNFTVLVYDLHIRRAIDEL
jgi:hypothetical protein